MSEFRDLRGETFGRWLVEEFAGLRHFRSGDKAQWECRCACGAVVIVLGNNLVSGTSTSCGCYKTELSRERIALNRNPDKARHSNFHRNKKVLGCKYCEQISLATTAPGNVSQEVNFGG